MAKNNKYKANRPASKPAQSATTSVTKPATAKADGECHVNVPVVKETAKPLAAALQQPVEVVQTPVVQVPPAESTVETWADAIADNSSYATADSDDPPTPPAVASTAGDLAGGIFEPCLPSPVPMEPTINPSPAPAAAPPAPAPEAAAFEDPAATVFPAEAVPEVPSAPAAPAVETTAPPAPTAAAEVAAPTPPLAYDMADEAALAPKAAAAAGSAVLAVSWRLLDFCLRVYTYPVYLTAGATVGLVKGVMAQLPPRH